MISKLFGKKKKNPAENKDKALQTIQNLDQLEAEMAKEEINLPDAIKEEVFQVPVAKEDIKKEEDALGDFLDVIKEEVFQVPVAKEDIKKEEDALGDFLA